MRLKPDTLIAAPPLRVPAHFGHPRMRAGHDHRVAQAASGTAVPVGADGAWHGRRAARPAGNEASPSGDDGASA